MRAWLSSNLLVLGKRVAPSSLSARPCYHPFTYNNFLQYSAGAAAGNGHGGGQQEEEATTLKGQLRRLFKLIHPDLFQNLPVEQAANQHSFQLLQEYLNAIKEGGSTQQSPYRFIFFIRQNGDAENLRKVEVSLPAPPQGGFADYRSEEVIFQSMGKAICQLLAACGLPSSMPGSLAAKLTPMDHIRLSELFQQASEIQRRNEVSAIDPERELAATKNALRLGRGIRVSFRPPLSDLSPRHQIESLENLGVALDMSQDVALSGHALLIGDCYGIDALGNIWLRYEDNVHIWSKFLSTVDLQKAAKYKKDASLRQVLELKAARAMEVEMVFTRNAVALKPDYTIFLNKLIDEAISYGAVGSGKFLNLPIQIIGPKSELCTEGAELDEASAFEVDKTFGFIGVPMWENVHSIYKYIEEHGNEALEVRRRVKEKEKHVEQVKLVVRKKLRLRHLVFDRKLRNEMCIAACMRLLHFAPEIERYMEGLSLCVSDEHRLPVEGSKSFFHLKWNFNLSEL